MSETIKTHSRPVSQKRSAYGSDLAARKDQEGRHGLITSAMQSILNDMRVQLCLADTGLQAVHSLWKRGEYWN
jgi:hypothetical protein